MFFGAERPKAARKKRIRVLPNREYPRTTTVDIPGKTASVSYLNAVISGLIMDNSQQSLQAHPLFSLTLIGLCPRLSAKLLISF